MSQKIELLNKVEIFQPLGDDIHKKLENIIEKRVIYEGEDLAVQGKKAFSFFILISGRVMLSTKEEKAVVLKNAGAFVGFELISSQGVYNATLKSLADGEIFLLDRSKFLEMIQEDSQLAESILSEWEAYLLKTAPFIEKLDYQGAESIY